MTIKNRLQQLEKRSAPARRIVVRYADQTPAEELEALGNDPGVILLIVEYVDKPTSQEVTA